MSTSVSHHKKFVMLGLLLVSAAAIAGTITINGYVYSCENQCVLQLDDGVWTLSDSGGGLVRRTGPAKKATPPKD